MRGCGLKLSDIDTMVGGEFGIWLLFLFLGLYWSGTTSWLAKILSLLAFMSDWEKMTSVFFGRTGGAVISCWRPPSLTCSLPLLTLWDRLLSLLTPILWGILGHRPSGGVWGWTRWSSSWPYYSSSTTTHYNLIERMDGRGGGVWSGPSQWGLSIPSSLVEGCTTLSSLTCGDCEAYWRWRFLLGGSPTRGCRLFIGWFISSRGSRRPIAYGQEDEFVGHLFV